MAQFSSKRIRGSAVVGQEGEFIFTPYASKSDEEKSMKQLAVSKFASLWSTANSYCIRLKISKKMAPRLTELVAMVMEVYNAMEADRGKCEEEKRRDFSIAGKGVANDFRPVYEHGRQQAQPMHH